MVLTTNHHVRLEVRDASPENSTAFDHRLTAFDHRWTAFDHRLTAFDRIGPCVILTLMVSGVPISTSMCDSEQHV